VSASKGFFMVFMPKACAEPRIARRVSEVFCLEVVH
jgi:hypothetical protein